jgi:hypothetical protein
MAHSTGGYRKAPQKSLSVSQHLTSSRGEPLEKRLDSSKEIAAYLNRDITPVPRWRRVRQCRYTGIWNDKRGFVYALAEELDEWIQSRRGPVDEPPPAELPKVYLPKVKP